METRGIVYVATGRTFVDEALLSTRSVRKQMPDIGISLFTDLQEVVEQSPVEVDSVYLIDNVTRSCRDKIKPLHLSPYEKTLFLDTDTYLCEPVYDLFDMLDRFDIALSQAPDRYQYDLPDLPACFTELNSGVIAFRRNSKVLELLTDWEETFERMLEKNDDSYRDQHSLRDALYRSDVQFFVLPPEYNFRTICPNFAGKHCKVKIIHGRHADMKKVAKRLNKSNGTRVFLTNPYRMLTSEAGAYESLLESSMNTIFQSLPTSVKTKLSTLRGRITRRLSENALLPKLFRIVKK